VQFGFLKTILLGSYLLLIQLLFLFFFHWILSKGWCLQGYRVKTLRVWVAQFRLLKVYK